MARRAGLLVASLAAGAFGLTACVSPRATGLVGTDLWKDPASSGGIVVRFGDGARSTQTLPANWDSVAFTLYHPTLLSATRSASVLRASMAYSGGPSATVSSTMFAGTRPGPGFWLYATMSKVGVATALGRVASPLTLAAGQAATASVTLATLPYWSAATVANDSGVAGLGAASGPALSTQLAGPCALAVRPDGTLYVAESDNNRLRRIEGPLSPATATASTLYDGLDLGTPAALAYVDDGLGTTGLFSADGVGNKLNFVDTLDGTARLASSLALAQEPVALAYHATATPGAVDSVFIGYVDNQVHQLIHPFAMTPTDRILVGTGSVSVAGVGGLCVNTAGTTLYVSDVGGQRVLAIALTDGSATVLAGSNGSTGAGDGGDAASASIATPGALAFDATDGGRLYVADTTLHVIRAVTLANRMIATVFGGPGGTSGDGGNSQAAGLSGAAALTFFADGASPSLFIADSQRLRSAAP